jgi:hypothetical protein
MKFKSGQSYGAIDNRQYATSDEQKNKLTGQIEAAFC